MSTSLSTDGSGCCLCVARSATYDQTTRPIAPSQMANTTVPQTRCRAVSGRAVSARRRVSCPSQASNSTETPKPRAHRDSRHDSPFAGEANDDQPGQHGEYADFGRVDSLALRCLVHALPRKGRGAPSGLLTEPPLRGAAEQHLADAPYGARQALPLLDTRAFRPRVVVFREAGLEARASSTCRVAGHWATMIPWSSPAITLVFLPFGTAPNSCRESTGRHSSRQPLPRPPAH